MYKNMNGVTASLGCTCMLVGLGIFLPYNRSIALIFLVLSVLLVTWDMRILSVNFSYQQLGFRPAQFAWWIWAILLGILASFAIRYVQGKTAMGALLPVSVFVSAGIGMTEEIIYRGYVFGRLKAYEVPTIWILLLVSLLHTAYKVAVVNSAGLHAAHLAILTFFCGLCMGYSRTKSGSVGPAIICHSLFDVLVYGDRSVPNWVW